MILLESVKIVAETASSGEQDLLSTLGIDWKILILQGIAFLITLWVLKRFVYPYLTKALDEREKTIEASAEAAKQAEAQAKETQIEIKKILKEARKEADDIVATAYKEATALAADAEEKAKKQAAHITSEAKEQIQQDVRDAKKTLRHETVELVALATEKIVKQKIDAKSDKSLIESALKESQ